MNLTFFLDSAVNIFFSPREVFGLKGRALTKGLGSWFAATSDPEAPSRTRSPG